MCSFLPHQVCLFSFCHDLSTAKSVEWNWFVPQLNKTWSQFMSKSIVLYSSVCTWSVHGVSTIFPILSTLPSPSQLTRPPIEWSSLTGSSKEVYAVVTSCVI
ncbi:uncharacterized protein YALI1_C13500g [Yarrowia lipolytica]|uniref:Uncharacterized protein n=1 Tax=Yarrowia lipolytica TaxID=4952 RepID=A0A1D8NAE6_YARLL|nr:hypothetical protein YALI1_C13500g [Yarrowia lipolytica]